MESPAHVIDFIFIKRSRSEEQYIQMRVMKLILVAGRRTCRCTRVPHKRLQHFLELEVCQVRSAVAHSHRRAAFPAELNTKRASTQRGVIFQWSSGEMLTMPALLLSKKICLRQHSDQEQHALDLKKIMSLSSL